MDDIMVPSATLEDHVATLRKVFTLLRQHHLRAKPSKCLFAAKEVNFLGHVVGAEGLRMEPDKIAAIVNWKMPLTTVRQVRQYVGMSSFYRSFVANYADKAAPLTAMTRKNAVVVWTPAAEKAVTEITHALTHAPVLQPRCADRKDRITTDASAIGLGAVFEQFEPLSQTWRPCAYWSKKLNKAQRNYAPTNREWLAVVQAVTKVWKHWVMGRRFEVCTDHAPLRHILQTASPDRTALQQRWYLALASYDFQVIIIQGKNNVVADALSRTPTFAATTVWEALPETPALSARILQSAAKTDGDYRTKVKQAEAEGAIQSHGTKWTVNEWGLLTNEKGQVWVPAQPMVKHLIISEEHEPPCVGHRGRDQTLTQVARRWWWPGHAGEVAAFVAACDRCQRENSSLRQSATPPQVLQAQGPGQILTLDFLAGFTPALKTKHTACLVVTDRFTRQVWCVGCKDHLSADGTVELLLTHVIARQGFPLLIVSDRGAQFESTLWTSLWERFGSRVALASSKHPQTDGGTERANRTLLGVIRKHLLRQKERWERYLPLYEMAINMATNRTSGHPPFRVALGRLPTTPIAMLHSTSRPRSLQLRPELTSMIWRRSSNSSGKMSVSSRVTLKPQLSPTNRKPSKRFSALATKSL